MSAVTFIYSSLIFSFMNGLVHRKMKRVIVYSPSRLSKPTFLLLRNTKGSFLRIAMITFFHGPGEQNVLLSPLCEKPIEIEIIIHQIQPVALMLVRSSF